MGLNNAVNNFCGFGLCPPIHGGVRFSLSRQPPCVTCRLPTSTSTARTQTNRLPPTSVRIPAILTHEFPPVGFPKVFPGPVSPVTDQAPHSHPRKRLAHRTAPSEINSATEDGIPSTSKLLALVDGPERVNFGDENISDEESRRRMSLILYP